MIETTEKKVADLEEGDIVVVNIGDVDAGQRIDDVQCVYRVTGPAKAHPWWGSPYVLPVFWMRTLDVPTFGHYSSLSYTSDEDTVDVAV